jgi:hypothetical protein
MKRLRAARQLVTRCTPFRFLIGPMSMMVEILPGLASMPRSDTTKPRSMPLGTPKTHFSGFSFTPVLSQLREDLSEVGDQIPRLF